MKSSMMDNQQEFPLTFSDESSEYNVHTQT